MVIEFELAVINRKKNTHSYPLEKVLGNLNRLCTEYIHYKNKNASCWADLGNIRWKHLQLKVVLLSSLCAKHNINCLVYFFLHILPQTLMSLEHLPPEDPLYKQKYQQSKAIWLHWFFFWFLWTLSALATSCKLLPYMLSTANISKVEFISFSNSLWVCYSIMIYEW